MAKIKYSFKQMCIDTNRLDILNRWDYEKNKVDPNDVSAHTNIQRWLKCPRGIHTSELYNCDYISRKPTYTAFCRACNSFAQHIIDDYDENYLHHIWSDKNNKTPWDYDYQSNKQAWFICDINPNHEYQQAISNKSKGCMCPYCNNRNHNTSIAIEKSLGVLFPETIPIWSDINEKTPFDYSPSSEYAAWWKCENGMHPDYQRCISASNPRGFRCPKCAKENQTHPKGEAHYNWKGGITPKDKSNRKCWLYDKWREEIYLRDGYTCQVCLNKAHNKLRAHHLINYSAYPDLRYDIRNGITCCEQCHDVKYAGSFHNIYWTQNNTPEQFQEYVIKRRKQLGIDIPFNIYDYMSSIEDDDLEIDDTQLDLCE